MKSILTRVMLLSFFSLLAVLFIGCSTSPEVTVADTPETDTPQSNESSDSPERGRYEGSIQAPPFPQGLDWINATRAITWEDLRGKIVILDFWTYGCINCIHMIPVLEQLQEKYSDEVVVLGVHSAKFENEGATENIRQIAGRYGRNEPIVNDSSFQVWQSWGARGWPTIAIVDPRGNVLGMQSGELPYEALDEFINNVEVQFDELGLIDRSEFTLVDNQPPRADSLLLYPGKVLADEASDRLFIADSNHNRIIITDLDGSILDVIGSGSGGFSDGSYEEVSFHKPQGLALLGNTLFVADLDNHAIRRVNLNDRTVTTVAGTGVRGSGRPPAGLVSSPLAWDLRSPWALEVVGDDELYIAMAGTHQIWKYRISEQTLEVAVGNGRESLQNGTLAASELAQPSGLYHVDGKLYFADSESSSIRLADLNTDRVSTVSGPARNSLFDFGDVDGVVGESLLQHPLGVTGGPDGTIYFADTYNSRIKSIDVQSGVTTTLFGLGGSGGYRDGGADTAQFDEPGGLDFADGKLYIADTNNHAIRVIDLGTRTVDTLVLNGVGALSSSSSSGTVTLLADTTPAGTVVRQPVQNVRAGSGDITVTIDLPAGYKLNPLIASSYEILTDSPLVSLDASVALGTVGSRAVVVPVELEIGESEFSVRLSLYYCESDEEQLCILDDAVVIVPIVAEDSGQSGVQVARTVVLPELPTFGEL